MSTHHYDTDYEIGQDNVEVLGMDLHHPVFMTSAAMIVSFVVATLIVPEHAGDALLAAKEWVLRTSDSFFTIAGNLMILVCIGLMVSPAGRIRLGGHNAVPEFTTPSWLAMLFSAGIGIGLMFWGAAEPLAYYTGWSGTPLGVEPGTEAAERLAFSAAMYHWGLTPWAVYAIVGLALAFFTFNKGLPLTIRSTFYPLLGERVWGWPGNVIDFVAVVSTLFGLATSLGFGAKQVASGLHYLFDVDAGISTQVGVIVGVTSVAVISVIRGLHGGVRLLSNLNMLLAAMLLAFVIVLGPTLEILSRIFSVSWHYARDFVPLSDWHGREDVDWYRGWTVFYLAWWISWSPFVGMFIARVSRGRTVREFIGAVLILPVLLSVVWFSAFGTTALAQAGPGGPLSDGIGEVSLTLFQMLSGLPLSAMTSGVAIVLVIVFFVTSSDSGSLVIDSITAGGKLDAPVPQRIFWAVMEGLVAAVLLYGGGSQALGAMQAGAITTALPFAAVLMVCSVSLAIALRNEVRRLKRLELEQALKARVEVPGASRTAEVSR